MRKMYTIVLGLSVLSIGNSSFSMDAIIAQETSSDTHDESHKEASIGYELICTVEAGNKERVAELILELAPLNEQDQHGDTALHKAAYLGHTDVIVLLLNAHASPTIKNNAGRTPLHLAASQGYVEAVLSLMGKRQKRSHLSGFWSVKGRNSASDQVDIPGGEDSRSLGIAQESESLEGVASQPLSSEEVSASAGTSVGKSSEGMLSPHERGALRKTRSEMDILREMPRPKDFLWDGQIALLEDSTSSEDHGGSESGPLFHKVLSRVGALSKSRSLSSIGDTKQGLEERGEALETTQGKVGLMLEKAKKLYEESKAQADKEAQKKRVLDGTQSLNRRRFLRSAGDGEKEGSNLLKKALISPRKKGKESFSLAADLGKTKEALEERGERLEVVAEGANKMEGNASDLSSLATQLRKKIEQEQGGAVSLKALREKVKGKLSRTASIKDLDASEKNGKGSKKEAKKTRKKKKKRGKSKKAAKKDSQKEEGNTSKKGTRKSSRSKPLPRTTSLRGIRSPKESPQGSPKIRQTASLRGSRRRSSLLIDSSDTSDAGEQSSQEAGKKKRSFSLRKKGSSSKSQDGSEVSESGEGTASALKTSKPTSSRGSLRRRSASASNEGERSSLRSSLKGFASRRKKGGRRDSRAVFSEGADESASSESNPFALDLKGIGNEGDEARSPRGKSSPRKKSPRKKRSRQDGTLRVSPRKGKLLGSLLHEQDNEGCTPLHLAVFENQIAVIKELVTQGARLDIADNYGCKPLHYTARAGFSEALRLLLPDTLKNKGSHIVSSLRSRKKSSGPQQEGLALLTSQDEQGMTPLHYAAQLGYSKALGVLLEKSADPNARDEQGWTVLHWACKGGYKECIDILYAITDYEVHRTSLKATPLVLAIHEGRLEVVKLLCAKGVDVSQCDDTGLSYLHLAALSGNAALVKELCAMDGIDVNAQTKNGMTPLHFAALEGYEDAMKILYACAANPNLKDSLGRTPLYALVEETIKKVEEPIDEEEADNEVDNVLKDKDMSIKKAVVRAYFNCIEFLVAISDDLITTPEGLAPLHLVVQHNEMFSLLMFIDGKANLNVTDKDYLTPLHYAAIHGLVDVTALLLENGATIHIVDEKGWTPLHYAAQEGHVEVVKVLLKKKAKCNAQTHEGQTALHCAIKAHAESNNENSDRFIGVAMTLLELGADANAQDGVKKSPFFYAKGRAIELLGKKGARLDVKDANGDNPLMAAMKEGNEEGILYFSSLDGVDIRRKLQEGRTLLHRACAFGSQKAVRGFLMKDADPMAKDEKGRTPLHDAAMQGKLGCVQTLFSIAGHEMKLTEDNEGKTPLQYALENNHRDVARFLLLELIRRKKVVCEKDQEILGGLLGTFEHMKLLLPCMIIDADGLKEKDEEHDSQEMKVLSYAVEQGHTDIVSFLVDESLKNWEGKLNQNDRKLLTDLDDLEKVQELIKARGITIIPLPEFFGMTDLHLSCLAGCCDLVKVLAQEEELLAQVSSTGRTALHYVVLGGYSDMIEHLYKQGAFLSVQDRDGRTPFSLAVYCGNRKIVEVLISCGARVNDKKLSISALHAAVQMGHAGVAQLLLNMQADIEATDACEQTPLQWAGIYGHPELAAELVLRGANCKAQDSMGKTVLHLAAEYRQGATLQVLIKALILRSIVEAEIENDELFDEIDALLLCFNRLKLDREIHYPILKRLISYKKDELPLIVLKRIARHGNENSFNENSFEELFHQFWLKAQALLEDRDLIRPLCEQSYILIGEVCMMKDTRDKMAYSCGDGKLDETAMLKNFTQHKSVKSLLSGYLSAWFLDERKKVRAREVKVKVEAE